MSSKKYARVLGFVNDFNKYRRQVSVLTQTKALQESRKQLWKHYKKALKNSCTTKKCRKLAQEAKEKLNKALPASGKWKPPDSKGNGTWFPDDTTKNLTKAQKKQINDAGGIKFTEGNPDFSEFAKEIPPPGSGVKVLPMKMTTNNYKDVGNAFKDYNKTMKQYGKGLSRSEMKALKKDYTFHHTAEGMQMVPKWLNNKLSHSGPPAYMRWSNY